MRLLKAEAEFSHQRNPESRIRLHGKRIEFERALTCCDWAVAKGLLAIRSSGGVENLKRALDMGVDVAQMTSQKGIRACFDAAKVMHLEDYGLAPGCDASFVLLQARDAVEAIRLRANRLKVWRKGTLVAETAEVVARLTVANRPAKTAFFKVNQEF